ncbi:unnamed protein product [Heterobilharzia americana]|nr:unnamed protein product [Heterobilharzia americana]
MVVDFTYSLVETRQLVKMKLVTCVWSPKSDLIALGSASGCISVHRYKMTCIWECDKSELGCVTHLAWRPDGKILTAAFSSGCLCFFVVGDGFLFMNYNSLIQLIIYYGQIINVQLILILIIIIMEMVAISKIMWPFIFLM